VLSIAAGAQSYSYLGHSLTEFDESDAQFDGWNEVISLIVYSVFWNYEGITI
jgi:hypothetical protein